MQRRIAIDRRRLAKALTALVGVWLAVAAPARGAEPEVTMRVLDDASDAPAVLAQAAAKQANGGNERRATRGPRANGADDATRIADRPDRNDRDVELDSPVDREQESESEIEDRDVPEDIDFEIELEDEDEE